MLTPIEIIMVCGVLILAVVLVFAVANIAFELFCIACKLLWLVFGIPARLLGTIRRRIP